MPIAAADLQFFGAANFPLNDTATVGGAIATATRVEFTQFAANAVAAVVSDGADTRTATVYGRLTTGVLDSEALVLNGTTEVVGTKTWERILRVTLSAGDASRTVSVRQGSGGVTRMTLGPNFALALAFFYDSTSEATAATRFEKLFARNSHATLTLTSAAIKLTADPAARIRIGAAPSVNDSATAANRKTAPASVTFVDDNVSQSVPGGNLAAGAAIGIWVEQQLPADDPATKSTFTIELAGSTT